jgi:hypothetical protein
MPDSSDLIPDSAIADEPSGASVSAPAVSVSASDDLIPASALSDSGQSTAEKKKAAEDSVVYDAAEFKRRVGRDPEPAELANFKAMKGKAKDSLAPMELLAARSLDLAKQHWPPARVPSKASRMRRTISSPMLVERDPVLKRI